MKTRQITMDAMMAAMCAVLGFIAIDLGNLKITFESLPILIAAMLFGPIDGLVVGGIGTLCYQLLRYGVSVTTPLWILPYILCGLGVGLAARKKGFDLGIRQTILLAVLAEFFIFVLNTGVIYLDSIIYGYYSAAYVFGAVGLRFVICIAKGLTFGAVLPRLLTALKKAGRAEK